MIQAALHLTAAALVCFLHPSVPPPVFILALILALLPDCDTPKSIIGSLLFPLSLSIERSIGHRTATHSVMAVALVAALAYFWLHPWWWVLAGAYATHLLIDLLIGPSGIALFWPGDERMTLAGWRDDGPAPQRLLLILLPIITLVALWPTLGPVLQPSIDTAVAVANPIAEPTPTRTPTPTREAAPAIHVSFTLPPDVPLSALQVQEGDTITEGHLLAQWTRAPPPAHPTPTRPIMPDPPPPLPLPAPGDTTAALLEAEAALAALETTHAGERQALVATQQAEATAAAQALTTAQQALARLEPEQAHDLAAQQQAVDAAATAVADADAAAGLSDPADAAAQQRARERVHAAEADLAAAQGELARRQTQHDLDRDQAAGELAAAQAALDALPAQQRDALAHLETAQQAARTLAQARLQAAQVRAAAADHERALAQHAAAATGTALATAWQQAATATITSHQAAANATAQARPTPEPTEVRSRVSGRIVTVSAQEQDGRLVVTLAVVRRVHNGALTMENGE